MRPAHLPRLALVLILPLALAGCLDRPRIDWPPGPAPDTPALLPQAELTPPGVQGDPGPALNARAQALRASLGL